MPPPLHASRPPHPNSPPPSYWYLDGNRSAHCHIDMTHIDPLRWLPPPPLLTIRPPSIRWGKGSNAGRPFDGGRGPTQALSVVRYRQVPIERVRQAQRRLGPACPRASHARAQDEAPSVSPDRTPTPPKPTANIHLCQRSVADDQVAPNDLYNSIARG